MIISVENLNRCRALADPLADEIVKNIFAKGDKEQQNFFYAAISETGPHLIKNYPGILKDFLLDSELPAWADFKKIEMASSFFMKNVQPFMQILGYYSLPYCYAAADGARVLTLSEKIKNNTTQRLIDTGKFVIEVMKKGAFTKNGNGIRVCINTRLRHALIRYKILKYSEWDYKWGAPINQEDMAGTNNAFSFIALKGLDKLGIFYSVEEANAFLHLWKLIGFFMGIDESLLTDQIKEAYQLDKIIYKRHFKKSEEGMMLTGALIKSFRENSPGKIFHPIINAYLYFFLGKEIAEMLGIENEHISNNFFSHSIKIKNMLGHSFSFPQGSVHALNLQLINNSK